MVLDDETNSRILPKHEFSWEYEALVYEFNIGIFLIASFVITDGLSDENKLEALLASTISDANQALIWLGITSILPMLLGLIFFVVAKKFSSNKLLLKMSEDFLLNVPKVTLSYGAGVSGVMICTSLYLLHHPDSKITFAEFLTTTVSFSLTVFVLGAFLTAFTYKFINIYFKN